MRDGSGRHAKYSTTIALVLTPVFKIMSHLNLQQSAQITVGKQGDSLPGAFAMNYPKKYIQERRRCGVTESRRLRSPNERAEAPISMLLLLIQGLI